MSNYRVRLHWLVIALSLSLLFSTQAAGINVDGVLDEAAYMAATPLNSPISVVYLVPTTDVLYIGIEIEDANIDVSNPQEFWTISAIEIWFDWGNEGNATFDENDHQFWFVPLQGAGDAGYAGQWHRAADNVPETMYDYANTSDLLDMAFTVDEGTGYTIEASIAAEALGGYDPNATIGFTYAVDIGGDKVQWDQANLPGGYWENPTPWPDLELAVVASVKPQDKLPALWGSMKLGL